MERYTPNQLTGILLGRAHNLGSHKALAALLGVPPAFLSDVLHGRRKPGTKILAYLGLKEKIQVVYVKK